MLTSEYLVFADLETANEDNYKALGYTIERVGDEPHLFENGIDTKLIPETWVKVVGCVLVDCNVTHVENEIPLLEDTIAYEGCFDTIGDFLDFISGFRVRYVYFHNLRYDDSYIESMVLNAKGYTTPNGTLIRITDRIMGDMGRLYEVRYAFGEGKKSHVIKFRDSAKIYNMTLN